MNPQKPEQLLHNFFDHSCLVVDVFEKYSRRHAPRQWFIAPLYGISSNTSLVLPKLGHNNNR